MSIEEQIGLSNGQLHALVVTERVNSIVSVLGILFIILTYSFSNHFNSPINRLIFFAAFSNLGTNIASLISVSGPIAGAAAPLCQIQGFLVQM
jgi:pheromone shutdown protein TraB